MSDVTAAEPLNVLIIVTDDQHRRTHEPMEGATWFPNFFATSPLCCPSRTSIMSGQYAHNHGVKTNVPQDHPFSLGGPTLQGRLQAQGYTTGMFGKFLNAWPVDTNPPGFDEWAITQGWAMPWNDNGAIGVTKTEYSTHTVSDRTDAFIRKQTGPWYAYAAPYAPHAPFNPEKKYANMAVSPWFGNPAVRETDKSDKPPNVRRATGTLAEAQYVRRQQIRSLQSVYDMRDRLIATLRERGELDNTLIFYLPDNGFQWSEHGLELKSMPYDSSVRVGAYVRGPGFTGGTDHRLVANIDVLPTVLAAAGVAYDKTQIDGRRLQTSHRTAILLEYWGNVRGWAPWASIRTPGMQYTEWYRADGSIKFKEYYNMVKDPWQLENRFLDGVSNNIPNRSTLHDQLSRKRVCVGGGCP